MASLSIVADENIPFAQAAFSTLGDVRLLHGRRITRAELVTADLLIVRSITRVDAALLEGTRVRFVGTATSGSDHVVLTDLERLGIAFYAALGCNANAVAEYMTAAWLVTAERVGATLRGRRVGVVGVGHVGSLVADKASALGMTPVLNDPPRARATGNHEYRPLHELLDCDIVTCHTPLTLDGLDPTFQLIGESFFSRLKPGAWFCNAGRGEVVNEAALHRALDAGRLGAVVLDVWDREPEVDGRLVDRVNIATPHIAGYSLEGKLNGTDMVYQAACRFLGHQPTWDVASAFPPAEVPHLELDARDRAEQGVLAEAVTRVYPILRDDNAFRQTAQMTESDRGRHFDRLRKAYPTRREFRRTSIALQGASRGLQTCLERLQFRN